MEEWIVEQIESLGYVGVACLMALENIIPPIPSEAIMPTAGYAARLGNMTLPGVILAGTVGSVLGNLPLYGLGWWIGADGLKRWADRHGKWLRVRREDIERAEEWFARWGTWAVLICRVIPGVRTLISLPAGFAKMPVLKFLVTSTIGTVVWTTALALLGWYLGEARTKIEPYISEVSTLVMVALVVAGIVWIIRKRRSRPAAD